MFICADCKEVDCAQVGSDQNACDNFTGEEDVTTLDVYGDEVYTIKEAREEIDKLRDYARGVHAIVLEQQRRMDTIIAAIVKAAGPEEER